MSDTKPFEISKQLVMEAYKSVKSKRGSAGIDNETIEEFEANLKDNLYKIWNRMSSGTYFPPAVKQVEIPKSSGGKRKLGIPTVADRIAQTVVKMQFEPSLEPVFHDSSFGYRPNKSAHDAIAQARAMCFKHNWLVEFDIKGLFDHIDHDLLLKCVHKHTTNKWVILYIERWLKAPFQTNGGELIARTSGTPQGGVISPLLANLFLHYCFDLWMERTFPGLPFERFADDGIIHCFTEKQAKYILSQLAKRFKECKLEIHEKKSGIIYCKGSERSEEIPGRRTKFTFLGYEFRRRMCKPKRGDVFLGFTPAVSPAARRQLLDKIRKMNLQRRTDCDLESLVKSLNPIVKGWVNYFGKYNRFSVNTTLRFVNRIVISWAVRKFKRFRRSQDRARRWLKWIYKRNPRLFAHWSTGFSA